jgi:hypothetical protein
MKTVYYEYKGVRGERYFRVIFLKDDKKDVTQVCVSSGKAKSGRGNCLGISKMSYVSLQTNYAFLSDFKESKKKVYRENFEKAVGLLK